MSKRQSQSHGRRSNSKHIVLFLSLFGIPTLLLGFQNCAPTKSVSGNSVSGGTVGIADDFNKTALQFVTPEIDVQSDVDATSLSGFCERAHDNSQLSWAIWSDQRSASPVLSGQASCRSGQFSLQVDQMDQLPCGTDHIVMVQGDWGGSTYAHVIRRCVPLASEAMAPPSDSPYGTECALEYNSGQNFSCNRVCYRDNKVVLNQALDLNQCSSLM
jgi:hypothetical protein